MLVFYLTMRNADLRQLKIIDSHTAGEPTRVVIELPDDVTGLDTGDLESYPYQSWFGADDTINAWAGTLFSTSVPLLAQILEQLDA